MFEFHNLGALAAGAVLIGGFQLGGHTGLNFEPEERMQGAKFVTVQGRGHVTRQMDSTRLEHFAKEREDEAGRFEQAMVVFDQVTDRAAEFGREVWVSLKK